MDAHAILHRAFHAIPNFTSPDGKPTGALYGFTSMLLKIIRELKPNYIAACYDLPEPTFRHDFYDKYKAQRPKTANELSEQIDVSKKILSEFGIPSYEAKGFEADDLLATITELTKEEKNLEILIVTGDLDTLQLVRDGVKIYTMRKGMQDVVIYDGKAVMDRFGFRPELVPDYKGLIGDSSDNIPGVKGIGEKTGKILIQSFGSLENVYKNLKKDNPPSEIKPRILNLLLENEEEAFFSKALAETRKDAPVDFSLEKAVWNKKFDKEKITRMFQDFGFRSLVSRIQNLAPIDPEGTETKKESVPEKDDTQLKKGAEVAYWLLDSRRTMPPTEEILSYGRTDSLTKAMETLLSEMEKNGLSKLFFEIEKPLIPILQEMENRGVLLDIGYLKNLSKNYHKKLEELQTKIWQMAGGEFNISSPKQLGVVLFEKMKIRPTGVRRTGTGVLSTRFSELSKIQDRHPIIQEIFSFRELSKLTSTYIDALPKVAGPQNRLHTSFNQTGTTTGRLSSSEPNLQNLPIRTDFGRAVRQAFIAPAGYSLVSFDYSQIELRIAASLSGDKKMIEAFKNNEDIHARVAAEVFNVPIEKVDKEMRRRAKVINFGIIYGMGINNLSRNLKCSREEAEVFYGEYFRDFSGMRKYINQIIKDTQTKGYTETLFKRRRYLPEINSKLEYIRKEAERMAVNAPIQGTATADIIKLAMIKINEFLEKQNLKQDVHMLLQVHDELLFEIRNDIIKKTISEIKNIMEFQNLTATPLIVDVSKGLNWGEMAPL